jgi:hypothetical protein
VPFSGFDRKSSVPENVPLSGFDGEFGRSLVLHEAMGGAQNPARSDQGASTNVLQTAIGNNDYKGEFDDQGDKVEK